MLTAGRRDASDFPKSHQFNYSTWPDVRATCGGQWETIIMASRAAVGCRLMIRRLPPIKHHTPRTCLVPPTLRCRHHTLDQEAIHP